MNSLGSFGFLVQIAERLSIDHEGIGPAELTNLILSRIRVIDPQTAGALGLALSRDGAGLALPGSLSDRLMAIAKKIGVDSSGMSDDDLFSAILAKLDTASAAFSRASPSGKSPPTGAAARSAAAALMGTIGVGPKS